MRIRGGVWLALAAGLLTACSSSTGDLQGDQTGFVSSDGSAVLRSIGERPLAADLQGRTVAGNVQWKLAALRGKVVLLNAWGPWCAPCRVEVPELQKLQDEFGAKGLQVVGLATRTNATSVEAFTRQNRISFPQVADYDSALLSSIGGIPSSTIPGSILIDRAGRVAGWVLGAADPVLIKDLVESLLEEQA